MSNMLKFLLALLLIHSSITLTAQAQTQKQVSYPCSIVLYPLKPIPNALGTALITKVSMPFTNIPTGPTRERESVGIYADWLPLPSSLGDYDQYEGFAFVPGIISWRFKMYLVTEEHPSSFGGTPWIGKFDEISYGLPENTRVELRLSNSKTNKLGPIILQNTLEQCSEPLQLNHRF